MIVVADTSPLNYLIRLGYVEALAELYGNVTVPEAVMRELRHSKAPGVVRAWALDPPPWLAVIRCGDIDETLAKELGAGEREAISLAIELQADALLIDDWAGRRAAMERRIAVSGTLAVVLRASQAEGREFVEIVQQLRGLGFRASFRVVQDMLKDKGGAF